MGSAWRMLGVVMTMVCAVPTLGAAYDRESRALASTSAVPVDGPRTGSLQLINHVADRDWVGVHLSPSQRGAWSANLLGGETTAPGGTFTLRDVPCGEPLDIKLVSSQKTTLETRGIVVACGETRRVALTR